MCVGFMCVLERRWELGDVRVVPPISVQLHSICAIPTYRYNYFCKTLVLQLLSRQGEEKNVTTSQFYTTVFMQLYYLW